MSNTFFSENRAVSEIMWKKCGTARQATDENITRRKSIACWIAGYRHTLRICNIYCFPTTTMVTRTRLNITFILTLPVLLNSPPLGHGWRWQDDMILKASDQLLKMNDFYWETRRFLYNEQRHFDISGMFKTKNYKKVPISFEHLAVRWQVTTLKG